MGTRTALQTALEGLLGTDQVYFQPPSSIRMLYPCIVYERTNFDTTFASNHVYALEKQYQVTVIYKDPDSGIPEKVAKLDRCVFDRHFVTDNLNHDVFNLYF